MKKKIFLILAMLAVVVCLFALVANAVDIYGISYTLTQGATEEENTATINSHENKKFASTELEIPVYVEHEDVKYYVTSMHANAFKGTNLVKITFESGSRIERLGDSSFRSCASLTTVVLPDNLKHIGSTTFYGCSKLTALYLPDSVETIGFDASGVSVSGNGSSPFAGCSSLYFVNNLEDTARPDTPWYAPENLQRVGSEFLKGVDSVNSEIVFGERCTDIRNAYAFSKMTTKHTIIFEGDFSQEGASFQYSCETWNLDVHFTHENVQDGGFIRYDKGHNKDTPINSFVYLDAANLKAPLSKQNDNVSIPTLSWLSTGKTSTIVVSTTNGTKEIPVSLDDVLYFNFSTTFSTSSFSVLLNLCDPDDESIVYTNADVVILHLNSNASHSYLAFLENGISNMPLLEEIVIDSNADFTFAAGSISGCNALESISISGNSITFATNTIVECESLKNITVSGGATVTLAANSISGCNALESISINGNSITFAANAIVECESLKDITVSGGTVKLVTNSLSGLTALEAVSITAEDTITFAASSISGCNALESISISGNSITFAANTVAECESLKDITVSGGTVKLVTNSLSGLTALEAVSITADTITYAAGSISSCNELKSLTLYAGGGKNTFSSNAISNLPSLETVSIYNLELSLQQNAISKCPALTTLVLDGCTVTISNGPISECESFETLDVQSSDVTFNTDAFKNNKAIKQVLMGSGHTYDFKNNSFNGSGLTSIEFPDNSTVSLGSTVFTGTQITYIYFGANIGLTGINDDNASFDGILTLEKIVIMDLTKFGQWAFSVGDDAVPLSDLTIYCHSADATFSNNAFNNRQNGGHKVFIYTADPSVSIYNAKSTGTAASSFNKCNYTMYSGIPHAFEYELLSDATCAADGAAQYVTLDCICGAEYRDNAFTTYSNIDTSINGVTHEAYGSALIRLPAPPHTASDVIYKIVYTNGFLQKGTTTFACPACNGAGLTEKSPTAKPLFECLGYSTPTNSSVKSITQGFIVNQEALELYNSLTNDKVLSYGAIAGVAGNLEGVTDVFANGELIEGLKVASADLTEYDLNTFDIIVKGIEKSESHADLPLYCCAYVLSQNGEETVSSYLTVKLPNSAIESEALTAPCSYNDIVAAIELMQRQYVGYDGYIWVADQRTDVLSAPLANDVAENTLELFETPYFTMNEIPAGTTVALMGNHFEYAKATQYSGALVSKLTLYVKGDGSLDVGKIDLVSGEYTPVKTASVTNGINEIELGFKLGINETIALGGEGTTVSLYSVSGVSASDEYGVYSADTDSFAISQADGIKDKLIVNVTLNLERSESACITPELEDVYANRTSNYASVNISAGPFVYTDATMFEGLTIKSMKLFINSVSYTDGYATMDIAVITVTDGFGAGTSKPSYNEVYQIRLPSSLFNGATSINAWYEIDLTRYAYKSDGTQASEGIVVGMGETLAFTANKNDKIVWGYNEKKFNQYFDCEQFYYLDNGGKLAFSGTNSVLNFLFYYEKTISYSSVKDHLDYLTELDKAAFVKAELADKQLSILGDSISTYSGVSNDASQGLGSNAVWYDSSKMAVTDTYWHQLLEKYGMNLCVNNSWSGAYVSIHKPNMGSDSSATLSPGIIRANHLANANGINPDYIIVYIGINDLINGVPNETSIAAYQEMLSVLTQAYPNAKIFCVNMPNRVQSQNADKDDATELNEGIKAAVDSYDNAYLVDLYNSKLSGSTYQSCSADNLHPNAIGMDYMTNLISEAMEAVILEQYGK